MKLKKLLLSTCIAMTIAGCNSDSSNDGIAPSVTKIKVIDGYIANATVYEDCDDKKATTGRLLGTTDSKGVLELQDYTVECPLIAEVNAGVAKDLDRSGLSQTSFKMTTKEGSVITPLTTLARLNNQDVSDLAKELGIDPEVAAGDYMAADDMESIRIHALARSIIANDPLKNLNISPEEVNAIKERTEALS